MPALGWHDGSTVATMGATGNGDNVRLWSTTSGQELSVHLATTDLSSATHPIFAQYG